jgi:hypothetical protein
MGNEDGLPVRGEIFPVYIVCVWGGGGGGCIIKNKKITKK